MVSTDLVARETAITLFPGATPNETIQAMTNVANLLNDVVNQRRLYQPIAGRKHVLIEGWQTLGSLTGVFATKDPDEGVREIPWPQIADVGEEPDEPGPEPKQKGGAAWEKWKRASDVRAEYDYHVALLKAWSMGKAYGFEASFRVEKDGHQVGWAKGRCDRGEMSKVNQDDHALMSMAETRGQSRALGSPLRFIVKLAGYEPTPAEEMLDGQVEVDEASAQRIAELEKQLAAATAEPDRIEELEAANARLQTVLYEKETALKNAREGRPQDATVMLDQDGIVAVVTELNKAWPMYEASKFMPILEKRLALGGIPESAGRALRGWAWYCEQPSSQKQPETSQPGGDS